MRQASRIARERQDISDANEGRRSLAAATGRLEAEFEAETEKIQADLAPDKLPLEEVLVQPKKSEINVSGVTLVWLPWIVRTDGGVEPGVTDACTSVAAGSAAIAVSSGDSCGQLGRSWLAATAESAPSADRRWRRGRARG